MKPLTYTYNLNVHHVTGIRPLELVLSRSPLDLNLHYDEAAPPTTKKDRTEFAEQLQRAIDKARISLDNAQRRYKRNFDTCLRKAHDRPTAGGWIFFDPSNAASKPCGNDRSKLTHVTKGPYKLLDFSARPPPSNGIHPLNPSRLTASNLRLQPSLNRNPTCTLPPSKILPP